MPDPWSWWWEGGRQTPSLSEVVCDCCGQDPCIRPYAPRRDEDGFEDEDFDADE